MTEKTISENLKEAKFILLRSSTKKPLIEKGGHWKYDGWKDELLSFQQANAELLKGFNVAVVCGINEFICIDCDTLELSQMCEGLLPKTYSEQTCSGGYHYFYRTHDKIPNLNIKDNKTHFGEIRSSDEKNGYTTIFPSTARSKYDGQLHEYKILTEVEEIPYITFEQLKQVIQKFMTIEKTQASQGLSEELKNKLSQFPELLTLFNGDISGFVSRSEAEQSLTNKLRARDFEKEEVYKIVANSKIGKLKEKPLSYWELMWDKSLNYVTSAKKTEVIENSEPLKVMNLQDYHNYKPSKDFIISENLNPCESTMLYAPSGFCKSLLMLYQAVCIASGKKYLQKYKTQKLPVLILSAENSIATDKIRISQILTGLKIRSKKIPLYVLPRQECQDIFHIGFRCQLEKFIQENKIKVLYLDTINPLTPELDDNKAKDVTKFFNSFCKPLIDDYKISIVFLHHTGKTENNYLGSVKWKANCDNVLRIDRKGLTNILKIYNEKNRTGEKPVQEVEINFSDKNISFRFLGESNPAVFTSKKKISQEEFFILKLEEFCKPEWERMEIYEVLKSQKIKFKVTGGKNSTLERAISKWRKQNE